MSVGKVFKHIRNEKGYTQVVMAEKLGVSLPSLKRFEANNVGMPNISTLENLAKIAETTATEVVRRIVFDEPEGTFNKVDKHLEYYISSEYLRGYSYEIGPTYQHKYVGLRIYEALLTKKREMDNRVLLDLISDLPKHNYQFDNEETMIKILLDKIFEVNSLIDLPKIKEYRFVEDYHHEFSVKVFEAMEKIQLDFIKTTVSIVLYDYKRQETVKYHKFSKS